VNHLKSITPRVAGHTGLVAALATLFSIGSSLLQAQDHAGQYEQADIEYGSQLYASHCITCHGENGDLMPAINLRTGRFPNAPTDRDLSNVLRDGIPGTPMIATSYNDSEITALVAFVRNITNVNTEEFELGDATRGQTLYSGNGQCASCHRINGNGPRSAPDLSNIGALRTAATLERALRGAEDSTIPINRPVRVVTDDGTVINGRRLNEDTFTLQLIDNRERLISLDKSTLREYTILSTSVMPSYAESLNDSERADLVAYLLTLKGMQ